VAPQMKSIVKKPFCPRPRASNPENRKCSHCYQIRTVLQIRDILEVPADEDVLLYVRKLKDEVYELKMQKMLWGNTNVV
jgi:hypothetical protein